MCRSVESGVVRSGGHEYECHAVYRATRAEVERSKIRAVGCCGALMGGTINSTQRNFIDMIILNYSLKALKLEQSSVFLFWYGIPQHISPSCPFYLTLTHAGSVCTSNLNIPELAGTTMVQKQKRKRDSG
ncbi:hypothetical protein MHYP_G00111670 [Metynnis hypsauchen]